MNACFSAGGASLKLRPMRAAGAASAGPDSPIRSRAPARARGAVRGRKGALSHTRAQPALPAPRSAECCRRRSNQRVSGSRASCRCDQASASPGRAALRVVRDVADGAFQVGRDACRLPLRGPRPGARAAAARNASLRWESASPSSRTPASPASESSPIPATAAVRADGSAPWSIASNVGNTSRAPPPAAPASSRIASARTVCERSSAVPRTTSSPGPCPRPPPHGLQAHRLVAVARRLPAAGPTDRPWPRPTR
jgi:hypothetical protein